MTRRGTLWFGWTLAALAMAGFAALGFWQYGRMHAKEATLAKVDAALRDAHAAPLSDVPADIAWVEGDAELDPRTLLLDNQLRAGRPGVHVYCLARVGDAHRLVDFGWVAMRPDRTLPDAQCPAGPLHVRGLSLAPPSTGMRLGEAMQQVAPSRWLMTRVDVQAIASALDLSQLADRIVRLDPKLPVGYARDLDVLPNTLPPERHLGYAVQWWALSLAVLATALVLTFRKKKPRP